MLFGHLYQHMPGEFLHLQQFLRVIEKAGITAPHLLGGHCEERPIISQPQFEKCRQAGTGQTTLEDIDGKRSYALNWCKSNNDDVY